EVSKRAELQRDQPGDGPVGFQRWLPHSCRFEIDSAGNGGAAPCELQGSKEDQMKIDPNDPKLTAYALGELDEAEQAAVERELIRSDAARRAVDEIRAAAGLLKEELSSEPGFELSQSQNALVEHRLDLRTTRNPW